MKLFSREFVKDRFSLLLMAIGFLLAVFNVLHVFLRVESRDFDIPVRYTQYGSSPIILGNWYTLYEFAIFAVVVTIVNFILALHLHKTRRNLTIALLFNQIVIMIFLFLVATAILGLPAVS